MKRMTLSQVQFFISDTNSSIHKVRNGYLVKVNDPTTGGFHQECWKKLEDARQALTSYTGVDLISD